ncbi:hypothetical protein MKK75_06145 [Methylobacterium sp. J-030]|uniref:hypothetical protein n=1 Tax=Methylobacterium sp. J-030 TaxID=2836627 RepID=UPI001FB95169|nr:hypothetical protein [Methylobacterium sp. J-030]MCJ2068394.1 hypothetical protein [Methylobacterium sp. J-030]
MSIEATDIIILDHNGEPPPGLRRKKASSGSRNGNYRHGLRTQAAAAARQECQEVLAASHELLAQLS